MKGIAYGVGVGPGDPEYMTLKAVRLIRENRVIAVPGQAAKESAAYKIAVQAVPELAEKELVPVYMPMVKDRKLIDAEHRKGAELLKTYLDRGENVVFLTLGDPSIYCTFSYIQHYLEADGYPVELVSGRPAESPPGGVGRAHPYRACGAQDGGQAGTGRELCAHEVRQPHEGGQGAAALQRAEGQRRGELRHGE